MVKARLLRSTDPDLMNLNSSRKWKEAFSREKWPMAGLFDPTFEALQVFQATTLGLSGLWL